MIDHVHVCTIEEPVLPDPAYLAHLDELLDLRVLHLPAFAQVGHWRLQLMEALEDGPQLEDHALAGWPMPAGVYTGLFEGRPSADTVWMSDIPREVWTMWDAIEALKDTTIHRVLITGLGLGVIVKHALRQPHITRIDVVEQSDEVLALVRPYYRDRRLKVHHGDALTLDVGTRRTWDFGYHDFWKGVGAGNLLTMDRVMQRYARRVGRQFCWRQADCLRMARQESKHWPEFSLEGIDRVEEQFAVWAGGSPT